MTCITKQRVGKYTYLYESTSFRDDRGRPRNRKVKIGKIDPYCGATVYTAEYAQKMGIKPVESPSRAPIAASAGQLLDGIKDFGVYWFLSHIAETSGLLGILRSAFPSTWRQVFTIASYLTVSDEPVMYCEDWLDENEWFETGTMSSQRISELLASFGEHERNQFYRAWYAHIREREYIALDITSVSSYSLCRDECEYGYNRDGEDLPQTNLCMLFGETSRLPVYQTAYSGSLGDVSTLDCTAAQVKELLGEFIGTFVMDKGFFSKKNVELLLERRLPFLVSVPFGNKFAVQLIEELRASIDCFDNTITTAHAPIRGVRREVVWGENVLHAYVFFDTAKAASARNDLFDHVTKLKNAAIAGLDRKEHKKDRDRYLVVENAESGRRVSVRDDVVSRAVRTSGWFVLLGSSAQSAQHAFDVYRLKDVVEKGFWRYKNSLGLDRMRVHTDERAANKVFVAFIALIISCHIRNTMKNNDCCHRMTPSKLFYALAKLKSASIGGHRILRPLTKQQKDIFEAFGVPLPVG